MEFVTLDLIKYVYTSEAQNFVALNSVEDILKDEQNERYRKLAMVSKVPPRFFDAFLKTPTFSDGGSAETWQEIARRLIGLNLNPSQAEYAVIYSCAMSLSILNNHPHKNERIKGLSNQYFCLLAAEERLASNSNRDRIPAEVENAFFEKPQLKANISLLARNRTHRDMNLYDVVVPGLEPGTSSM